MQRFGINPTIFSPSDVRRFGNVDRFSAFQFERKIGLLKQLIRKGEKSLQQLVRRLYELNHKIARDQIISTGLKKCHRNGSLLDDDVDVQYSEFINDQFHLKCDRYKDDCVLLKCGTIVIAYNFVTINDDSYLIGEKLVPIKLLYKHPCKSKELNISIVVRSKILSKWKLYSIDQKVCKIPFKDKYVVVPILH
ncbi:hypothetical protein TKK_0002274 [Trichogramma kaykai]